jgi:hypothetical protein
LPGPRQAEQLRRDLAERLEALRHGLVTPPIHPRDRERPLPVIRRSTPREGPSIGGDV